VIAMGSIYGEDLAYIQAAGFGKMARGAAPEIVRRLSRNLSGTTEPVATEHFEVSPFSEGRSGPVPLSVNPRTTERRGGVNESADDAAASCARKGAPIPTRRVVDVGCGAGPLAAELLAAGFEVTGIDSSADLLAIARSAAPPADYIFGSLYEVELPACEAIVALGEALTYHDEGADADALVERFFRKAAAVLPEGGMMIFDVIEIGEPSLRGRNWSSGDDWAVMAEIMEDQDARALMRRIETFRKAGELYRRGSETHRVRLFDSAALVERLETLGFAVETGRAYGAWQLGPRRRAFFCRRV